MLTLAATRTASSDCGIFDLSFHFWRGTSGHSYVHWAYTLMGCPAVPAASVMLVRASPTGRVVLDAFCVNDATPSSNLATIRQRGAQLGANEVHLHFAAGDLQACRMAAFDLSAQHGQTEQ